MVTVNGIFEVAESPEPVFKAVIGFDVAPVGTVTTNWVAEADVITALVAPK